MSKTKERILEKALELLNERGVAQVSIRSIGDALSMSPGNLCYHYPNVDAIVEALYFRLVADLDALILESMQLASKQGIDLHFTFQSIERSFATFQHYKFLMLDFADIMRRHETLKAHFRQLAQQRQVQFMQLIQALQAGGWVQTERYPSQFQDWIQQASLLGDYWMASAEIMLEGDEEYKRKYYQGLFFSTLAPHLTAKGLEVYQELLNKG
ncbi:MAG: TetR/AcrR family transcriptional regulator [Haliscomenobacter sp.]|nr:TetR/AcrR family transcriptional regulator [Haliscomenobacter sp.]MBK9489340.1 TetR/AcrR family transcriptional regulator [Haliscomenobacter sp.]